MSARMANYLRALASAVVVVFVFSAVGCEDTARMKELQAQAAEKDQQIKELQERLAAAEKRIADLDATRPTQYLKPDKDDEYAQTVAGAALDSLLAGDVAGIRGTLSAKLQKGVEALDYYNQFNQKIDSVHEWVTRWNPAKQYKSYSVEKVVQAPMNGEYIVQGALFDANRCKSGTFSITLVKEGDKGKFLLDAASAK